ncbi:hypothetical protein [Sphingobacterium sp. UME9]|uniref:hypothetical protein n=1 Tax=Sphingobacterium sp. UME9 TaxID=1862316 RepID=UPI0016004BA0|nr:hypothetical protein [Sphingobacterium sp. UME9]MBB1644947.1 hypothetical protein [Sphingobacterium sp. UME9]
MAAIAIIDDNFEQSETICANLEIEIEKNNSNLKVISSLPFRDLQAYFNFIEQNDVCILILDEKLNDQSILDGKPVEYKGSDLVKFLRHTLKNIPIYSVTSYHYVEELKESYSQFEDVIKRTDFIEETEKYFKKMWRLANNYLKENITELSEFNDILTKISSGDTTPDLQQRLKALQVKLELPFAGFDDRRSWLEEYDKKLGELQSLNEAIKKKLNS